MHHLGFCLLGFILHTIIIIIFIIIIIIINNIFITISTHFFSEFNKSLVATMLLTRAMASHLIGMMMPIFYAE